jgi:hypothetical protein
VLVSVLLGTDQGPKLAALARERGGGQVKIVLAMDAFQLMAHLQLPGGQHQWLATFRARHHESVAGMAVASVIIPFHG